MSKVYFLDDRDPPWFPDPSLCDREGLVAVSETLGHKRLILAYQKGIFPWFKTGEYSLWHWFSPDPRFLLFPNQFKTSRTLKKALRDKTFRIQIDQDFRRTMEECAASPRSHEEGTWIEKDMIEDYCELHRLGIAHSIEAYHQDELVGGLYGLYMGNSFFGESMFHKMPEASKVCLAKLVKIAQQHNFHFIDCQVPSAHLKSLGACETEREKFLKKLEHSLGSKPESLNWNSIK